MDSIKKVEDRGYYEKVGLKEAIPESESEIERLAWLWPMHDQAGFVIPKEDWEIHHCDKWHKYVKKFDVCVQAGGCGGMYPRLLAKKFQVVYTFEPIPINFFCLVSNCQAENVIKIQAALGSVADSICMKTVSENAGMHRVGYEPGIFLKVPLDSFNLALCDLIWLDVEEHEYDVLMGAVGTIERHSPTLMLENGHIDRIQEFLHHMDYELVDQSGMDSIYVRNI